MLFFLVEILLVFGPFDLTLLETVKKLYELYQFNNDIKNTKRYLILDNSRDSDLTEKIILKVFSSF